MAPQAPASASGRSGECPLAGSCDWLLARPGCRPGSASLPGRSPCSAKASPPRAALRPLSGLRIVEGASFVAAPSAGMALAQLGADVIRVDPPGGGSDFHRWPLSSAGDSLFWASLDKGKRSVTIDHRRAEGRELLIALATEPGRGAGIFLDNMVGRHRLTYEDLRARREDVVHVHLQGRNNGSPAVDYTINAEVGVPQMTGPQGTDRPVNHVLPAWDLPSGMVAASGILAAVLHRDRTAQGAQLELAPADVAPAGVGSMGWLGRGGNEGRPARPRRKPHVRSWPSAIRSRCSNAN
ncbi:CoA transferase [Streptomyces sparsogenes]|uniref:CoA transferase n=1 Tax=Streptomyces sparsogenes TaxID=67365 RepID=UPI00340EF450